MPNLLDVKLSAEEMAHYTKPFEEPESRIPILRLTNEIPIEGQPADMAATVGRYSDWFRTTSLPFRLIWSKTGATLVKEHVEWCQERFQNLMVHEIQGGHHFFQESNAPEFVATFKRWWGDL